MRFSRMLRSCLLVCAALTWVGRARAQEPAAPDLRAQASQKIDDEDYLAALEDLLRILAEPAAPAERLAFARGNAALACLELGRLEEALAHADAGIELARANDLFRIEWRILNTRGAARELRGEMAPALEDYRAAIAVVQEHGHPSDLMALFSNVSVTLMHRGDYEDALEFIDRSLELALERNDRTAIAATMANRADVMHLRGETESALELQLEALALREELGLERDLAHSHQALGLSNLTLGRFEEAERHLRTALEIEERLGLEAYRAATLSILSRLQAERGLAEEAVRHAEAAYAAVKVTGADERRVLALDSLARAHELAGNFEAALDYQRQCQELVRGLRTAQGALAFEALRTDLAAHDARILRLALAGTVLALLCAAIFGWLMYSQKDRALARLQSAHGELEILNANLSTHVASLERAARKIERLETLLPLCASCKSFRGEDGAWHPVEEFLAEHAATSVTHGMCPTCAERYWTDGS